MGIRAGNLVALPFNAASSNERQRQNVITFGLTPEDLWQQTIGMMREHYDAWRRERYGTSYSHFLHDRFAPDDGESLGRIESNRDAFLEQESHCEIPYTGGIKRINYGHLIVDMTQGRVVGERRTGHFSNAPETAGGFDVVRPSERNKGLSHAFFELGCLVAQQMGYGCYEARISSDNQASYRRLDHMVENGRATRLPDDWGEGRDTTRCYRIDLKTFSPQIN